jgi:hypothetical protein
MPAAPQQEGDQRGAGDAITSSSGDVITSSSGEQQTPAPDDISSERQARRLRSEPLTRGNDKDMEKPRADQPITRRPSDIIDSLTQAQLDLITEARNVAPGPRPRPPSQSMGMMYGHAAD